MTFQFERDGATYLVHTEVGDDQFARVVVSQDQPHEPEPLEESSE